MKNVFKLKNTSPSIENRYNELNQFEKIRLEEIKKNLTAAKTIEDNKRNAEAIEARDGRRARKLNTLKNLEYMVDARRGDAAAAASFNGSVYKPDEEIAVKNQYNNIITQQFKYTPYFMNWASKHYDNVEPPTIEKPYGLINEQIEDIEVNKDNKEIVKKLFDKIVVGQYPGRDTARWTLDSVEPGPARPPPELKNIYNLLSNVLDNKLDEYENYVEFTPSHRDQPIHHTQRKFISNVCSFIRRIGTCNDGKFIKKR